MKYTVSFEVELTPEYIKQKFRDRGDIVYEGYIPDPVSFIEDELGWLQAFNVRNIKIEASSEVTEPSNVLESEEDRIPENTIIKSTDGYVTKEFDLDGNLVKQNFTAGDSETEQEYIHELRVDPYSLYHPFDMVQP